MRLPWAWVTPLGRPVEPDVNTIDAGSLGKAPAYRSGAPCPRGTSASGSTGTDSATSGRGNPGDETTRVGPAVLTACSRWIAGDAGLNRTEMAPTAQAPSSAEAISGELSIQRST